MAMAEEPLFKPGQLVWAKMKGYPYWPGKVMDDSEVPDLRKPKKPKTVCVKFFGSGDLYAFIALEDVNPYFRFQSKYSNASKRKDFVIAVRDAETYVIANPEVKNFETGDEDGFDETKPVTPTVDRSLATDGNVSRNEGGSGMPTPAASPKRTNKESSSIARPIKRMMSPSNGPDSANSSAAKRYASSPPSVRIKDDFQNKKIGFIGLGMVGSRLVKRLIAQGFRVTVYDRCFNDKITKDLQEFAQVPSAPSPAALMQECDIVFCCVYDSDAAREVVFGANGVVDSVGPGKSYIELTTVDPQTAIEIFDSISAHGGRFLEAPLSGLKKDAADGRLVFLCAGDKSLFDECGACFQAIGRRAVFFGNAGNGAKLRLLHQMLAGVMISGVAEIAAAAYRCGLSIYDLSDVIGDYSPMGCSLVKQALKDILEGVFEPSQQLGQMQRELQLAMTFTGYELSQPTCVAAAANQVFLFARRGGEEMSDASAIYRILSDSTLGTEASSSSLPPQDDAQGTR